MCVITSAISHARIPALHKYDTLYAYQAFRRVTPLFLRTLSTMTEQAASVFFGADSVSD
ncbi:hypothetical protein pKMKP103_CDS0176 [Klebsiella phage pKMKP103]|nr:hypothetical protein pKMKP103_CDS0176 [Klebsiella phage pKMKP103]